MKPAEYKYLEKTKDGYDVVALYQDYMGYLNAIIRMGKTYTVGVAYNPTNGRWGWGHYDFESQSDALRYIKEDKGRVSRFNPENAKHVYAERNAQYYYNNVSADYMKSHFATDPDFDAYHNSHYYIQGYDAVTGKRDVKNPTREGYEQHLKDYRRHNQPWRSDAKKPSSKKKVAKKPAVKKKSPAKKKVKR
ncbi:MAG: hypothetical protein IJT54_10035 [Candidatus Methanomethylophilaceae archaeon]|nr:hypothetical protein [Candidatus Methanomethylophilaceae archaeon]